MATDPYRYFRVEANELVDQLGKAAMDLEKGSSPELVARLLRLAHTLKGAARVVKQREIADHAHAVEEALASHRQSSEPIPRSDIDAVLALLDGIGARVAALSAAAPAAVAPAATPERARADEPLRTVRTDVAEVDELLEGVMEAHAQLGPLRRDLGVLEHARHLAEVLSVQLAASGARGAAGVSAPLNEKMRGTAEELTGIFTSLERGLASGIGHIDRELRQVRGAAEGLRLVAAGTLFTSLERTARDTAQALGKRVVFEVRGADVRLDAHVLGSVQSALLQMVRNAVAHGIEPEAERRAASKPAEGRVRLEVVRRGRRVSFACRDDGRGVDLDAVRRAAQRRGLRSADIERLGSEELLGLLLKGGISTSGTVTEVSGRGIGLDVVRDAAAGLGGEVVVRTEARKGTTVELMVPLSLASVEGLMVEASGVVATIPLDAVKQTVRVAPGDVARTPEGESIVHEGKVVPFISLSGALAPRQAPGRERGTRSAVIIGGDRGGVVAVGVDRLVGTGTVVLRPLPELAPSAALVAGASLDAEGNPQIMLDANALVAEASRARAQEPSPQSRRLPILVIDDSLTTRMLEQSILESAGYEVDVATSGEDALEKAKRNEYALFLVDIEMPGIDGFTFIERARADPALRSIPAILVSSRAAPEDRQRGQQVGAQGYVVKSEFDQGLLLDRIRQLVGQ